MTSKYSGHHPYNNFEISLFAPEGIGVYYLGIPNVENALVVHYVGRAKGEGVTIKSRLLAHLREGLSDITHFGYILCNTAKEAEDLEAAEIVRLQPKHNKLGKNW